MAWTNSATNSSPVMIRRGKLCGRYLAAMIPMMMQYTRARLQNLRTMASDMSIPSGTPWNVGTIGMDEGWVPFGGLGGTPCYLVNKPVLVSFLVVYPSVVNNTTMAW